MNRLYELGHMARSAAAFWSTYGFAIWAVAVLITAALGFIGFSELSASADRGVWDRTYLTLQLVVLESGSPDAAVPWELEVARIAAPALAAIGLIGIASLFVQALTQQDWRLRWTEGHTIVCGLGERGSAMTKDLRSAEEVPVVAIETGAAPQDVEACRGKGALILKGDATDTAVLEHAGLHRADRIVVMCGADGVNAEVAANVIEAVRMRNEPRDTRLKLYVQLSDLEFRHAVEETLGTEEWREAHEPLVDLVVVNAFERLADLMLDWSSARSRSAHLDTSILIAGLGTLGESVLLRAIETWRADPNKTELRVQILDRKAASKIDLFRLHYERIFGPLPTAVELSPCCIDLSEIAFERHEYQDGNEPHQIFVCVNDDPLALATSHTLKRGHDAPIAVRMSRHGKGLAMFLGSSSGAVRGFGVDEAANGNLLLEAASPTASANPSMG